MTDKDKEKKLNDKFAKASTTSQFNVAEHERKQKKKKLIVTVVVVIAVIVGIFGVVKLVRPNQEQIKAEEKILDDKEVKQETKYDKGIPVELPEWAKHPHENRYGKYDNEIMKFYNTTEFYNFAITVPSEEEGFTSDTRQIMDGNGLPNPLYNTSTAEEWEFYGTQYIMRFINPIYGNWEGLSQGKGIDKSESYDVFKDMFTKSYWNKNSGDFKWLPIMADWKSDNFNKTKFTSDYRWFGEVNSITTTEKSTMNGKVVDVDADVTYYANTKKGKIKKQGNLSFTMIDNSGDGGHNIVIADNVKLKLK